MRCNRNIYRKEWFKVSNRRICKDIKVDLPIQMCQKATLLQMHKIVWTKSPPQLFKLLKFNTRHRECSSIGLTFQTSKQNSKQTNLEAGLILYNKLPLGMKLMPPRKFKEELSKIKNIGISTKIFGAPGILNFHQIHTGNDQTDGLKKQTEKQTWNHRK